MASSQTVSVPVEIEGVTVMVEATCLTAEIEDINSTSEIESQVSGKILSFEEVSKTITAVSTEIAKSWAVVKPTKATLEFGVEVQYQPGQLLARIVQGSSKVNLKITLEWSK